MLAVNRADLYLKSSHNLSHAFTTNLLVGISYVNFHTLYDLESELKWKVSDHLRLYLSLKYSIDGF